MSLRVLSCEANDQRITLEFSQDLARASTVNLNNYYIESPIGRKLDLQNASVALQNNSRTVVITLPNAPTPGQWLKVRVTGVTSAGRPPAQILKRGDNTLFTMVASTTGQPANELTEALRDIVGYPLLAAEGGPLTASTPAQGPVSLQATVDGALRKVLGRLPKGSDTKSFVNALNQTFTPVQTNGQTVWQVNQRTFAGQTDLGGGVTGAQASLAACAKTAYAQSAPLLAQLYSLIPEADEQEVTAARALLRTDWAAFVNELGTEGGPRAARANQLGNRLRSFHLPNLGLLLGMVAVNAQGEPLNVNGNVALHENAKPEISRTRVITLDEEQNLTSYITLIDLIHGVDGSWDSYRENFFQKDLGTGLVLLARRLSVVAESVQESYAALDSVFVGPAERLAARVDLFNFKPMVVEEILSWAAVFAAEEAPLLIQEGGTRGVAAILPTLYDLRDVIGQFIGRLDTQLSLPKGLRHPRVRNALNKLLAYLNEVVLAAHEMVFA